MKRFKSGLDVHDRNVTSNGSWQSSNDARMNQDILSAKIDSFGPDDHVFNVAEYANEPRPATNKNQ